MAMRRRAGVGATKPATTEASKPKSEPASKSTAKERTMTLPFDETKEFPPGEGHDEDSGLPTEEKGDGEVKDEAPRQSLQEYMDEQLTMGVGFDRIIDTMFVIDSEAEYKRIKDFLTLSGKASEMDNYGVLVERLDEASSIAAVSLRLYANAKVALKNYEAECDVVEGTLRNQAIEALTNDKKREKRITNDDIESKMKTDYSDEWRALAEKREKAKQMVGVLEGMIKVCNERNRDLRQMVASARH